MLKQKDVPQSISGKDELDKDELHNVVEGERRRMIGFKRAGCAISGF